MMLDDYIEHVFKSHSPKHYTAMREIAIRQNSLEGLAAAIGAFARDNRCDADFPNPYRGVDEDKAMAWDAHFALLDEPAAEPEVMAVQHGVPVPAGEESEDEQNVIVDADGEAAGPNFDDMTEDEIVEYVQETCGVKLNKRMRKDNLIAAAVKAIRDRRSGDGGQP